MKRFANFDWREMEITISYKNLKDSAVIEESIFDAFIIDDEVENLDEEGNLVSVTFKFHRRPKYILELDKDANRHMESIASCYPGCTITYADDGSIFSIDTADGLKRFECTPERRSQGHAGQIPDFSPEEYYELTRLWYERADRRFAEE